MPTSSFFLADKVIQYGSSGIGARGFWEPEARDRFEVRYVSANGAPSSGVSSPTTLVRWSGSKHLFQQVIPVRPLNSDKRAARSEAHGAAIGQSG